MPVTIIGPSATIGPRIEASALVYLKALWSDNWSLIHDVEPVNADDRCGSMGIGECTLEYKTGHVKGEGETEFADRELESLRGWWVKLVLAGDQGLQMCWQGQIESEVRQVYGSGPGATFTQRWVAASAARLMQRRSVATSWWDVDGAAVEQGWLPSVNLQGRSRPVSGNRNGSKVDGTYLFGRDVANDEFDLWTTYDFLEYLMARFMTTTGGPTWTIGGETDVLKERTPYLALAAATNVFDVIRRLVTPRDGLDFALIPTTDGWELRVFTLTAYGSTYAGVELPANANVVRIEQGTDITIADCRIEQSTSQRYDRIRVIGERAKVVTTLYPPVPMWSTALETAYKNAAGAGDTVADKDAFRAEDGMRTVYQHFGAGKDYDPATDHAAPSFTNDGTLDSDATSGQRVIRATLPRLLLRQGWDYTTDPPTAPSYMNSEQTEADFLQPFALVYFEAGGLTGAGRYIVCDKLQQVAQVLGLLAPDIGVRVMDNEWGLELNANPNHVLAKNHWSPSASEAGFRPQSDGGFDWEDILMTIAFEGNHRLGMVYDVPEALKLGDGSEITVYIQGAEYWYLAPDTIVGVAEDGDWKQSPRNGVVLRNDIDKIAAAMAGAIDRYTRDRIRARVSYRRMEAWGQLIGHILQVIDDDQTGFVGTPLTAVSWDFRARTTDIRAGYAE
jgi:hypothetical protein